MREIYEDCNSTSYINKRNVCSVCSERQVSLHGLNFKFELDKNIILIYLNKIYFFNFYLLFK